MRATIDNKTIHLVLSKRNLLTLLNKLEDPGSQRTLIKDEGHCKFVVYAQSDEDHYADRPEGGPGEVHPDHDPSKVN